jgi:2-iminobutanoate/2-iminopropanoate deaminase
MKYLQTEAAPAAVGPYSQGILGGKTIYVSGQLPMKDGQLQTNITEATTASLNHVLAIVQSGGGKKENIVKCVVFINDMNDFKEMNEAYDRFFGGHKPARSCIEVSRLPKDAVLEIEAIAVLD